MLVDLFRVIMIILKFLFHDFWVGAYHLLFVRQNEKIKNRYFKKKKK